jgi:hypothetical protein
LDNNTPSPRKVPQPWGFSGDQQVISSDTSFFREGSGWNWQPGSTGYALVGSQIIMKYWSHNAPVDANGNFLGCDDAGACAFWCYAEDEVMRYFGAPAAAKGTVPVWTLYASYNNATGVTNFTSYDPTPAKPAWARGRVFYDNTQETLAYFNDNPNVTLNIGQESYIHVRNITGSSIANGTPVYISGSDSGLPTVAPASATTEAASRCVGLLTDTIATGTNNYATQFGVLHNIDTSAFAAGATLYVSAVTPGTLTTTQPVAPNNVVPVALVVVSSATVGSILVMNEGYKYSAGVGNAFSAELVLTSGSTFTVTTTQLGVGPSVLLICNSASGAAKVITLPASTGSLKRILVVDGFGDAATNNITFTGATVVGANLIYTNKGQLWLTDTLTLGWVAGI